MKWSSKEGKMWETWEKHGKTCDLSINTPKKSMEDGDLD